MTAEERIRAFKEASSKAAAQSGIKPRTGILRKYRPLILAMLIFLLGVNISKIAQMNGNGYKLTEHFDESAISVNSPSGRTYTLTMGELGYYILRLERVVDEKARAYDSDNPSAYWKIRISTKDKASYVTTLARETVLDYSERDLIYAADAEEAGLTLTEEELKQVRLESGRFYLRMSEEEKNATGLTAESLESIMCREALAKKRMESADAKDTDVGSAYYTELKDRYDIQRNDDELSKLRVGYITINNGEHK